MVGMVGMVGTVGMVVIAGAQPVSNKSWNSLYLPRRISVIVRDQRQRCRTLGRDVVGIAGAQPVSYNDFAESAL